jgi:hypothetical protein
MLALNHPKEVGDSRLTIITRGGVVEGDSKGEVPATLELMAEPVKGDGGSWREENLQDVVDEMILVRQR